MKLPWPVPDLMVVGYADSLTCEMLPATVPPVFLTREAPPRALLPPFTVNGGVVYNFTLVPAEELQDLAAQSRITLFSTSFDAREDYLLWLDEAGEPHYDHRSHARAALDRIAKDKLVEAEEALGARQFEAAERACDASISANDGCLDPFVIQAVIRRINRDEAGVALIREMAPGRPSADSFDALVQRLFCRLAPPSPGPPVITPRRFMHNIATMPAEVAA